MDNVCIQPSGSDLMWFQCLTCCPSPPTDSRYCSAVLKLLQGYVIQRAVLSLQIGFSSSSCCDEQRFENPILLLENPPSNIRKTSHPLDMRTHINSSKCMKASQRKVVQGQGNTTDCFLSSLQKHFTSCPGYKSSCLTKLQDYGI